jgi:subtilisin family serine protease
MTMRAPHIRLRALPALTCLLSSLTGSGLLGQPARVDPALFERVAAEDTISVIVELATGSPSAVAASGEPVAQRQQAIALAQEELVSGLRRGRIGERRRFEYMPFVSLEVDRRALEELAASPLVAEVRENGTFAPTQSGGSFAQYGARFVEADLAQAAGYDGSGFAVAVIDTGVDSGHPFFGGRVVAEACFSSGADCPGGVTESVGAGTAPPCTFNSVGCQHGTHVAGIAAGGVTGFTGVAPGASVIAVNASSNVSGQPRFHWDDLAAALEHVYTLRTSHTIAAVNMSLGDGAYASSCDASFPALSVAVGNLSAAGIAVTVSTGNDGQKSGIGAPACLSQAVAVGATGGGGTSFDFDSVTGFSNSSSQVDLLAPGRSIDSAVPGGGYGVKSGTSMAAPHAAGAFALLRQQNPSWNAGQVLSRLQATGFLVTDTNLITTSSLRLEKALFGGTPLVVNDRFVNATTILGPSGLVEGSNYPSTKELGEPFHAGIGGGSSVWFGWQTPAFFPGRLQGSLDTILSSFDTALAVYTGTDLANLTEVTANDDAPGTNRSRVTFAMAQNEQYWIAVDGFGGLEGDVGMFWQATDSNLFTGRRPIAGASGQTTSTNIFADKELSEPAHAGKAGGASIWWSWTAPFSGSFVFDTFGSAIDTLLAVYTGEAVPLLVPVVADDDSGGGGASRLVLVAQAGTTYQIVIDGDLGATGDVVLNWAPTAVNDRLEVHVHGLGSVSGLGIACPADCEEDLPPATSVTLTAVPQPGWAFTGWGGACFGQGSICTLVTAPTTDVDALFDTLPLMSDGFESGDLSAWSSAVP